MTSVIFAHGRGPVPWLIMKLTKSKVSHAAVGFDLWGFPMVVHASIGGIRVLPRSKFSKKHVLIAEYAVKTDITKGLQHTASLIDRNYDYKGLFGFLFVIMAAWFKRKIKNPLASPTALFCSEFVLHLDKDDEIPEWNDFEYETTTPGQLMSSCSGPSFTSISIK